MELTSKEKLVVERVRDGRVMSCFLPICSREEAKNRSVALNQAILVDTTDSAMNKPRYRFRHRGASGKIIRRLLKKGLIVKSSHQDEHGWRVFNLA